MIVQFGDYVDATSAAQAQALADALRRWPNDVRVAFVPVPSATRPLGLLAAQTAAAGGAIDRYWEVHDRLFAKPPKQREDLERIAAASGLDVATWAASLADGLHRPWIDASVASARELGVVRAGAVFVNGRAAKGDASAIMALVASEREAMTGLVHDGLPRSEIYAEILAVADSPAPRNAAAGTGSPDPATNYAVPAADRPVLGPIDAPVTIIVFSDFQCPFCARVQPVLEQLRAGHPDEVRVVFRNLPLAFHQHARELAKVALAADAQGKFWPMHDLIFARKEMNAANWKPLAKRLRLNAGKMIRVMNSEEVEQKIVEDEAAAKAFGVNGTPSFFINGRFIGGAQPIEGFERIVNEELVKAKEFAAHDPGGAGTFYDRMIEGFTPAD